MASTRMFLKVKGKCQKDHLNGYIALIGGCEKSCATDWIIAGMAEKIRVLNHVSSEKRVLVVIW